LQLLTAEGTGARIQIATGEHDAGKGIEVVSFSDGTQLTVAQLLARLDDSQEVLGSTWNDRLVLGAGDDVIDGVQGNDLLVGGRGNDVVRFGRGGGQDVIDQTGAGASDVDVLRFADDVQVADVTVFRDAHDLHFEIADSGDLVVVKRWFDGGTTRLASVEFAGGVVVDASAFDTAPFRGVGEVAGGVVAGSAGNDTLSAAGGSGNWARLEGAAGDDVLHAGWGAKTLSGGAGDDVYVFGRGDGAGSVFRNGPEPGEDDGGGQLALARRDGGGGSRHGRHQ
jgi:Ca2+-binding RTX toxin-like protein